MSLTIPATKDIITQNKSKFESKLNQTIPAVDKSFLNVLSTEEAVLFTLLYKYAAERSRQNLALTATGEDLDLIGSEYDVIRGNSQASVLSVEATGTDGTVVQSSNNYTGDSNGLQYSIDAGGTVSGGALTLSVTASELGVIGNLEVGETLSIGTPVPGLNPQAEVLSVTTTGTEEETDESYRTKILDVIRAEGGGANATIYRTRGQTVSGVARCYPYTGNPTDLQVNDDSSVPPERTVYVEADSSVDPDGIAPTGLLNSVRTALTVDPDTGADLEPLGLTSDTLYVESIIRTSIFTEVRDLDVPNGNTSGCQTAINTALTTYYEGLRPYIDGIDPEFERNDTITDLTVSKIVQNVLDAFGATASGVGFGLSAGTSLTSYILKPGELSKNSGVSYV